MVTKTRASSHALARDLEVVSMALSEIVFEEDISEESLFTGIQAFLMALESSGQVDAGTIKNHLLQMAEYFHDIRNKA